jgi:hypothetical protein
MSAIGAPEATQRGVWRRHRSEDYCSMTVANWGSSYGFLRICRAFPASPLQSGTARAPYLPRRSHTRSAAAALPRVGVADHRGDAASSKAVRMRWGQTVSILNSQKRGIIGVCRTRSNKRNSGNFFTSRPEILASTEMRRHWYLFPPTQWNGKAVQVLCNR